MTLVTLSALGGQEAGGNCQAERASCIIYAPSEQESAGLESAWEVFN